MLSLLSLSSLVWTSVCAPAWATTPANLTIQQLKECIASVETYRLHLLEGRPLESGPILFLDDGSLLIGSGDKLIEIRESNYFLLNRRPSIQGAGLPAPQTSPLKKDQYLVLSSQFFAQDFKAHHTSGGDWELSRSPGFASSLKLMGKQGQDELQKILKSPSPLVEGVFATIQQIPLAADLGQLAFDQLQAAHKMDAQPVSTSEVKADLDHALSALLLRTRHDFKTWDQGQRINARFSKTAKNPDRRAQEELANFGKASNACGDRSKGILSEIKASLEAIPETATEH